MKVVEGDQINADVDLIMTRLRLLDLIISLSLWFEHLMTSM